MRIVKILIVAVLALMVGNASAAEPVNLGKAGKITVNKAKLRGVCANSESQIDQEINNVRARLLGGGDCWWDFSDGRYIVPKVDPASGQREVSSIFAGSVWLGGIDPGGNLKLACQDYRQGGNNDFWSGPLTEQGVTDEFTCKNWDRHFRVTGDEIRAHLKNIASGNISPDAIPRGVKGWPARGNLYFRSVYGFDLPFTQQALAGFYDADNDELYDPLKGDYPSIEIRGCPLNRYPDEMVFWIYNDHGGGQPHANTQGKPIQMEVQVQAFGYTTNDELNDMTFQRYKLINRATERIDSMFFAMWIDPDLGCAQDDYIGCDQEKALMYVYNQDNLDGDPGCSCGDVATYCDKIPILGVDYFRGPLDTFGEELGMSSFMYYNNGGFGNPPAGTADPSAPQEFYNYITGTWRDGTPLTIGGSGYAPADPNAVPTRYAFPDAPNNANGWSMCTSGLTFGDRRTLQASGPFTLKPGAVNELIIGIPWVPDITYPCPDLEGLFRADKLAQGLFDNCFELLDGPDAPTVAWLEVNREIIAILTNDTLSNNAREGYAQNDFLAPEDIKDTPEAEYRFEGYVIYQLTDPNVSAKDYENPDKARIVAQVDVKNNISKIYNWLEVRDPNTNELIFYPELKVDGADAGIRHTFSIQDDKFASGNDKGLINHKKYYFSVVAYAYNNFGTFDPIARPVVGQQRPYLAGRRNIQIYTVIPRPVVDQALQASYGDGVEITRLQGVGVGNNFVDLTDASREAALSPDFDNTLTYKAGRGPVKVTIFNPFEIEDGEYELSLVDDDLTDNVLKPDARWELRKLPNGDVIASERTISELNEQLLLQYGFSITLAQTGDAGNYTPSLPVNNPSGTVVNPGPANGGIGAEISYADSNEPWLFGFPDQEQGLFHYVKTRKLEDDADMDPNQGLSTLGDGYFVPYVLADWRLNNTERMISPAWTTKQVGNFLNQTVVGSSTNFNDPNNRYRKLNALPNVDIVLTSDTSKWSRCIVVESASGYWTSGDYSPKDPDLQTESPAPNKIRQMFDTRYSLSVGKDDNDNDGLPDPDGATDANGNPIYGMGWFPGYAIDVETGKRLNIFFGENSCYKSDLNAAFTGRDMLWNPTDQFLRDNNSFTDYFDLVLGGQHWVYVTNTNYDECAELYKRLSPEVATSATQKITQLRTLAWAGMVQMAPGFQMKSLRDGLIPNDATIKLRVDNPYAPFTVDANNANLHPKYLIKIDNRQSLALNEVQVGNALDSVKVVPNPYYGFSDYETSQFTNTVKITNLPGKCTVTIYSLDGKFIRQYQRNEQYAPYMQITPALEWDLKNNKGIQVASGVYLIHVSAPGMGERTLKWFGIARQFDASGLN
ncbi:MAG: hypothetical protein IPL65_00090 [Lewinellaceae bacterium]|nr:hypothetical protein [Lewinellaceae bacterium]